MLVANRTRSGLVAGLALALLAGCSDPGALTRSDQPITPLFTITPPGPGQTYWDFVDENGSPGPFGGRTTYNNNRTINDGFGTIKFSATLQPGVPGIPQVVFQWFAHEQTLNDEKGVGICRRSPGDQPSPCYTGGEIGEGSETKDLTMDLTGLASGLTLVSIRLSSLQDGENFKVAFCTTPTTCGPDINGTAGPNDDLHDLPAPPGTKFVILKRGNPGAGANDYLLAGITTEGPAACPGAPTIVSQDNGNGTTTARITQSLDVNDNSYGVNSVGWGGPGGHKFSNLTGSDRAQFIFRNGAGAVVLDFDLDYLSATTLSATKPSGYASLGLGGDGGLNSGNAAHILSYTSSLDKNLNDTGYCSAGNCSGLGTNLLVDSPNAPAYPTPPATYAQWDFHNWYEVTISNAAFGPSGPGTVSLGDVHNSPDKDCPGGKAKSVKKVKSVKIKSVKPPKP